jgi:flagellar motility protein MotE (MotC chaperone)
MRSSTYVSFSLILVLFFIAKVFAEDKKSYTAEEFNKAVEEKVHLKINKLHSSGSDDFSKELLKKEKALEIKEIELRKREENVNLVIKDFEGKVIDFNQKQEKILGCLTLQDKMKEDRTKHMVEVVSGMKPDNAAQVLSVQDEALAVEILGKLDAAKVSKIFNVMEKEISARLQKMYMTMKK